MKPFELVDPDDAIALLADVGPTIRERGETYLREGAVEAIEVLLPGEMFRVRVRGTTLYHVEVVNDELRGWDATCDCPYDLGYCKHSYAAVKDILSHAGYDSSGRRIAAPTKRETKKTTAAIKTGPPGTEILRDLFEKAKGASASKPEGKLLGTITGLFHAIRAENEYVCGRSLQTIGIGPFDDNWSLLTIWTEPPANDHEFWLYAVQFAHDKKLEIPAFMAPVSDLERIQAKITRARRVKEVRRWQSYFKRTELEDYSADTATLDRPESDLRFRMGEKGAVLEILRPDKTEYVALTNRQIQGMVRALNGGEIILSPTAEMIWGRFQHRAFGAASTPLIYDEAEATRILYGIFSTPALRGAVVMDDGKQVSWSPDPLSWKLSSPGANPEDDYRLALTYPDGSPVKTLSYALTGSPSYFIVGWTLHAGPPFDPNTLNPRKGIRLPREAVENTDGIAFLHRLGVALPEPLARRVRTIALRPRAVCQLVKGYQEHCEIQFLAVNAEGESVEEWHGREWFPIQHGAEGTDSAGPTADVEIVSRKLLAMVPEIIGPLNCRDQWNGTYTMRVGKTFADRFCEWLDSLPATVDVQLLGELADLQGRAVSGSMKLEAEETEVDWFDLSLAVQVDDLELTPEEIKLLVNAKGGWVRLEDKGWRRLDYALSAEDDKQLAHLGLNPRALDTEPQRIHALQLANPAANKFLPAAQVEQLQLRAEEIQARVTPDIPASISAELRPYQTDGFHFLSYLSANNFGGILADDMGLGKTLQTLTWLIWLREQGETGPSLVVCPKSVMDNWQAEAKRFTTGLRTYIWPPGEVDQLPDRLGEADLHVINYNQLRKLGESLLPIRFLTAILDEGQYIKNPSSQTAQIARALNAAHRLVLTGTPIENRLLDLWSLMTFAMPGILGSRAQFGKLYNAKDDPFARLRLSSRVRPFLIRRTKSQVAQDLPERIEEDLYCEIEGEQKKLYQAERKRAQQILLGIKTQKQLNELRFNFLTSLLHLRQICCHPKLFRKDSRAKSAKLEAVMEQLETIIDEGAKVLVFSQFVELLELIQPELEKKGWPIWKLTGRTENRGQLVESFQNQEGPGVFLISLKAGGAGLNLTAASYVVLFDPWWNPAVENQAIDRTHRIGQTSKVIAYRLLIKNSIEEKIRELQKGKQALAEDVLGEEKFSQSLSMDDFQYLLGD
jgi:hypothetical protein